MKITLLIILFLQFFATSQSTVRDYCSYVYATKKINKNIRPYNLPIFELFLNKKSDAEIIQQDKYSTTKKVKTNINNLNQEIVIKRINKQDANLQALEAYLKYNNQYQSDFLECQYDENYLYLAFRLFPKDLTDKEFLSQFRQKSGKDKLSFYFDLFKMVVQFSKLGYVHRKIEGGSIKLDDQGHPHLTEFDFVEMVGEPDSIIGDKLYISPARFIENAETDPATDIYSLAIVIFGLQSEFGPKILEYNYFKNNNQKLLAICFEGNQVKSCVRSVKAHVVEAFKNDFGDFQSEVKNGDMNFTTLVCDILKYKSNRDCDDTLQVVEKLLHGTVMSNNLLL